MLKFPLRESSFSALTLPLPEIAPAALSLSAEPPPVMRESPRTASFALRLPEISDSFAVSFPLLSAFPATVRLSAVTLPSKTESEPSARVMEPAVRVPVMSAPCVTVMLPVPPVVPPA